MKATWLKGQLLALLVILVLLASACAKRPALGEITYDAGLALLSYETVSDGLVGVVYRRVERLPAFLGASQAPVLLAFYDPNAQGNVLFIPVLEQMAADLHGQLQIVLVNARREEAVAESFQVQDLPHFMVVVAAAPQKSLVGFADEGKILLEELIAPYLD